MSTTKTCLQCGITFEGRPNKIYCSDSCKMQFFRQEKAVSIPPLTLPKMASTTSASRANRSVPVDKTTVELEKLRLQTNERLKQMEYDELERKRKFEIEQAKQRFDLERDQEEWRLENEPPAPPNFDQTPILNRLDELDRKINQPKEPTSENTESEEEEGGSDLLVMSGLGVLGYLFLRSFFTSNKPQNTQPSPPLKTSTKSLADITKEYLQRPKE